jgi:hypothetical protein
MKWAGYAECKVAVRNALIILDSLKERYHSEDLDLDVRII